MLVALRKRGLEGMAWYARARSEIGKFGKEYLQCGSVAELM